MFDFLSNYLSILFKILFICLNASYIKFRIMEQLRLEGTSRDCLVQSLCLDWGQLRQTARGCIQSGFDYLQWWGCHNLSGQPVLMFDSDKFIHSLRVNEFLLMFQMKFLYFSLFPMPFVLELGTSEKSLASFSLLPPIRYYAQWWDHAWTFSSPGWKNLVPLASYMTVVSVS